MTEAELPLMHHTEGPGCQLCDWRLSQCHSYLAGWVRMVRCHHPDVHVACGWRDQADQEQAYKSKLSNEEWPNSLHNIMINGKPCSYAVDLFQIDMDGHARFQYPFYKKLYDELTANGDSIVWGGQFKRIADYDHFQIDTAKLKSAS